MREPLSHPRTVTCPTVFFAPAPATARFNNSTEKHRPGISHPRPVAFFAPSPATVRLNNSTEEYRPDISLPRPAAFSAPAPGTALFNNITEKYRSPLYRRLMGGESHA